MEVNAGKARIGDSKVSAGSIKIPVLRGEDGLNATIQIGEVTTVDSSENAEVFNTGTDVDVVLNFKIPKGADGGDYDDTEVKEEIENIKKDFENYYLKTETFSQTEVLELIGNIKTVTIVKVDELPQVGNSNVIYLVAKEQTENNIYNEYIYVNNVWELIGNTEIDLDNYVQVTDVITNTEIDEILNEEEA